MSSFTAEEHAMLVRLVPVAQRLIKNQASDQVWRAWLASISDHERTLLMRWIVSTGPDWSTARLHA